MRGYSKYLEGAEIQYIIVARHYVTIQRKIASIQIWWKKAARIQIGETTYQKQGWEAPRRLVVVQQKIFAIEGYITKQGNQRILKMSLAMKRRK